MEWKKRDSFNTVREVFLRNVGAKSYEEVKGWFTKDYHIKGLEEAAKLILTFKDKRVTIVGDYDCDGQASTSILYMLLKSLSFNGLHIRIPHRFSEGYGISEKIVEEIPEGLVITVDNGIAQLAPITKAKEKGLTVIVLDHHLLKIFHCLLGLIRKLVGACSQRFHQTISETLDLGDIGQVFIQCLFSSKASYLIQLTILKSFHQSISHRFRAFCGLCARAAAS